MNVIEVATSMVQPKPDVSQLLDMLKDRSLPLEDRWAAYKIACDGDVITRIETYGDGFVDHLTKENGRGTTLYDDFYIEKYQTVTYMDLYDSITDEDEGTYSGETVTAWKEMVLATAYKGFTYDW